MQANWSLVLNVLFLVGVVIAIARMLKVRRKSMRKRQDRPSIGQVPERIADEIIAVRKVAVSPPEELPVVHTTAQSKPTLEPLRERVADSHFTRDCEQEPFLMMFLLAKENRQLAGYELLQTVLSAGLRFGEGHLFHRHQFPNGQGPVLFSLAAATPSGVFDMQNIGAFNVHGLCLFMQASGNPTIDAERFTLLLDTGRQLSEGLDTHLLDERRQPLTDDSIQRYCRVLQIPTDICLKKDKSDVLAEVG